jgi:hypothetical protein
MIAALLAALLVSSQVYAADMALRATPGLAAMASAAGQTCALAHSPSDFSSGFEDDASAAEVWSHPECSKDSGPQCHAPNRTCSLREIGNCSRSILEQSHCGCAWCNRRNCASLRHERVLDDHHCDIVHA